MSDEPTLSRRDMLKLAAAACLTIVAHSQLPGVALLERAQLLMPTRLAALLTHSDSARVIGKAYLHKYPQDARIDILLDQIAARLAASNAGLAGIAEDGLRAQLDVTVRADFAADRIVKLQGWILSTTEAQLCALATLL